MRHHQRVYKGSISQRKHFTKSATIPVLTPSGPEWSCFLQRQVMCNSQLTVNQRYDFNPLPFQHFRWHNSTFFSLRAAVFKIDASHLGPSYMVSGTRDSPPPKATLSSVFMWKRSLCRSSQSNPFMIIHNLHWVIRCTDIPLSLSFPRSFARSGFFRVNFDLFDANSCLKS